MVVMPQDYAREVGSQFAKVDPAYGVRSADFNAGMAALPDKCFIRGKPAAL